MKGSEAKMTVFMEGADKRFVIPVYQRKYDWKYENCRQLYNDLKRIVIEDRNSHFFGSIVSAVVPNGSKIEYHIIDGQQRLTTITLLLLAIRNLIAQGKLSINEDKLDEQISHRFLISPWASEGEKVKLCPVKNDREALLKLFGDEEDYDNSSNLTINYRFFYDMVMKEEIPVVDLYAAIGKLEIISITLDKGDNAQLIFESLNSTGLALTEGDKIRNYVLMGLTPQLQAQYYDQYWSKIEKCTANDVSGFIRDYLSIKQQVTPTVNNVYRVFKNYAETISLSIEGLLSDLLRYARLFEKLLTCKSGLEEPKIDDCLYRLMRLDIVVTRPFLMEVLRLQQDGKLTNDEVLKVFLITESYLFRRNICEVPTNALNKIFVNLNKEIIRYDNTLDDYVSKFIYALLSKKESGRFPDDEEFGLAISEKQVYLMRGKYKAYLFERFENYGTIETKDVYTHLDNNVYTIEHIMPQNLTPAWKESLGDRAKEIHETWLHRLANLTLTGYNPTLSNNTFIEKRDVKEGGYKSSGLKMNQKIAMKDRWGLAELEERNREMQELAMKIWAYPKTDFVPEEKEYELCTLDDENIDLTGREIAKYAYLTIEQSVTSWTDMIEHVIKYLHQKDKSVLMSLAYGKKENTDLTAFVANNETELRRPLKIDENLYIEKNTNTISKITILRKIFALYKADPMDLVFYLKDSEKKHTSDTGRFELRKRYWEYALPIIQEKHSYRGTFVGCDPTTSNVESGFFGMAGFCIKCIANYDHARVQFYLNNVDQEKNKEAFDKLFKNKNEIEDRLGVSLIWQRATDNRASWIDYRLDEVSIINESDWPRIAKFHAEWSDKILSEMLEHLLSDQEKRYNNIASIFREWVKAQTGVHLDVNRCNRTYTRFTTDGMTTILPDIPCASSGWNTDNHYFYEIINKNGKTTFIQLSISSKNATDEFRSICDKINEYYPSKMHKKDWQWRMPFKTRTIELGEQLDKNVIFERLDVCLQEIFDFESDLKEKLRI